MVHFESCHWVSAAGLDNVKKPQKRESKEKTQSSSQLTPQVVKGVELVLVQIDHNYAQWHNLHHAQHVAHQVAQYCESYAH